MEEKNPQIKNLLCYQISEIDKVSKHIENLIKEKIAPVHGLVLAGGKSTRMGTDKGTLNFYGKNQRDVAIELLEKHRSNHVVRHLLFNIELGRSSGLYHTNFHAEIIATSFSMLSFHVFDNVELNSLNIGQDDVLIEIIKYHLRSISTEIGIETINSIDWKIKPS